MPGSKLLAELQTKVSITVIVASSILFSVIILNDFLLGFHLLAAIKLPILLIFGWAFFKLKREGFKERNSHLVNIPVLILFIINYISNQGTDGPTLAAFLSLFVVYPILLSNRLKWIYAGVTLTVLVSLLFLGIDKSNLIKPVYASAEEQFIDHAATHIAMAIFLTVLVSTIFNFYKRQNYELIDAQQQLAAQMARVESDKKQKEYLLGILAHDVRGPIVNLSQLLTLYQAQVLSEADLRRLIGNIQSRMIDLESTIENVLSQIKLNANLQAGTTETVDPKILTQELVTIMQYKFEAKNQKLVLDMQEAATHQLVYGQNANEVALILKNLIDNAHKYSPVESTVRVELRNEQDGLRWQVIDQGPGIAEDLAQRLFKQGITSKQGTGVGLYLCTAIAERIGAELTYSSTAQGSVFQLSLAKA
jgi:signal transduction histidine kinase